MSHRQVAEQVGIREDDVSMVLDAIGALLYYKVQAQISKCIY